jgi:hypothetical protein
MKQKIAIVITTSIVTGVFFGLFLRNFNREVSAAENLPNQTKCAGSNARYKNVYGVQWFEVEIGNQCGEKIDAKICFRKTNGGYDCGIVYAIRHGGKDKHLIRRQQTTGDYKWWYRPSTSSKPFPNP